MKKNNNRFVVVEDEGSTLSNKFKVIVDTKTGVNYLFMSYGYGGGLTPLLDAEGKPIVSYPIVES